MYFGSWRREFEEIAYYISRKLKKQNKKDANWFLTAYAKCCVEHQTILLYVHKSE